LTERPARASASVSLFCVPFLPIPRSINAHCDGRQCELVVDGTLALDDQAVAVGYTLVTEHSE